ncbi:hypothetical protein [Alkaliphilus hydrothermalis]|uniref:Uncharacterized protein n=1 Tax=Alkaliphilus hydrothermalis TaxID=1482730 RepID=A0ABS2NUA6_9FIRM|nr:hypothetical protein [Alkaliphilus hydrothermalis]MBM7616401.1 hypothetical protein [Alkaliphilus hydrothermalis]
MHFTYTASTFKGNIIMTLVNTKGENVLKKELVDEGQFDYEADFKGVYKIIVSKSGVACRYSINWQIN